MNYVSSSTNATSEPTWPEAFQQALMVELTRIAQLLEGTSPESRNAGDVPRAVRALCQAFNLSPFERDVLLLCAGVELDSRMADLIAARHDDASQSQPTFALCMSALPGAHWSALTPDAPLRRWRLIELRPGQSLVRSPMRIDERVLHFLTGVQHLDERLVGMVVPIAANSTLPPSQQGIAKRMIETWEQATDDAPVLQLCGLSRADKRAVAVAAANALGWNVCALQASDLPQSPGELEGFIRAWEREAVLGRRALLLEWDDDPTDTARDVTVRKFVERARCALIVSSRERLREAARRVVAFDVDKPTTAEQRELWSDALGPAARSLNGKLDALVAQFDLSAHAIHDASASNEADAWDASRAIARSNLDDLAQRIEPAATWDDLVLPVPQLAVLREIATHVRQRATVYEAWGFARKGKRGLGISALFTGESGTGKTMTAEVLAQELRLDLYRIDLSQVVSKYIGETEKNLRRVFDAAEDGGAVLLFDEADALFGKRSEVKDSHDRYANIEVSYLLQRMEAYRGLAILTTNMRGALDPAFMRRLRFVVNFPFPDAAMRAQIWQRIFPRETPVEPLPVERLAQMNVAGGAIRNIALRAAFLAADAGQPVQLAHVQRAARAEYAKLEKPAGEIERAIGG